VFHATKTKVPTMPKVPRTSRLEELVRENERLLRQVATLEQEVARLLEQTNGCTGQTRRLPQKLLDQRVDSVLQLSAKANDFLSAAKIIHIGQLIACATIDLRRKGSGVRVCREIEAALKKINISLGTDVGNWFPPEFR
jgi:cell division septum initiation protein DivIVA